MRNAILVWRLRRGKMYMNFGIQDESYHRFRNGYFMVIRDWLKLRDETPEENLRSPHIETPMGPIGIRKQIENFVEIVSNP